MDEVAVDRHGRGGMNVESFSVLLAFIQGEIDGYVQGVSDSLNQGCSALAFATTRTQNDDFHDKHSIVVVGVDSPAPSDESGINSAKKHDINGGYARPLGQLIKIRARDPLLRIDLHQ